MVIVNHRYKELIKREEIIGSHIIRENDISAGERYIKELIVNNNILSEEEFKNQISNYFKVQILQTYILNYEKVSNRFILTNRSSRAIYYYKIDFKAVNPNLTEITY